MTERVTQPWFSQDILQNLSTVEQQVLARAGDPEMEVKAAARTDTGQSEESWGRHTASSPREHWQRPLGERQVPRDGTMMAGGKS